ncbi:hypothetical protein [Aeoliella sp.]|uniref:hypothetical protein n=1 Tax=Aeoliella sp. TaxID=2795800 RepID=UPI003CCBF7D8
MLKRILTWTGIACGLFVVYMLLQLFWPAGPIKVSRETTFITEPLADDGLPNYSGYLLAHMREGVTPENNGAIPFLQAMWPAGLDPTEQQLVCNELGMEMPGEEGLGSRDSNRQLMSDLREWCGLVPEPEPTSGEFDQVGFAGDDDSDPEYDLLDAIETGPWTAEDAAPMAHWLEEHGWHFDLLYEAVERDKFYFPSPTLLADPKASLLSMTNPGAHALRSAANRLRLRANLRLGSGDIRGAWNDCRVIYQLADVSTHSTVLCGLMASKREEVGNAALLNILQSPEITPELANEITKFLAARRPQHNMRDILATGARVEFISDLLSIAGYRGDEPKAASGWAAPRVEDEEEEPKVDWTAVLRIANEHYDLFLEAVNQPTYDQQQQALATWADAIDAGATKPGWAKMMLSRNTRSEYTAYSLQQILGFTYVQGLKYEQNNLAYRQLHQTAVALSRYQLATGEYPESLEALIPKYLDALPIDPFDRPIVYQRTTDGYLLYSLGANGIDEGGSSDELRLLQGYPIPEDEAAEKKLRQRLGESVVDVESEDFDDTLVIDESFGLEQKSDDIAIRLPLLEVPIPKFERDE